MKTLPTLVLLALICFLHHGCAVIHSDGSIASQLLNEQCCLGTTRTHIPRPWVKHVAASRTQCSVEAIVITTVCEKKFCVDGDWIWAKKLLEDFQKNGPAATECPNKRKK